MQQFDGNGIMKPATVTALQPSDASVNQVKYLIIVLGQIYVLQSLYEKWLDTSTKRIVKMRLC